MSDDVESARLEVLKSVQASVAEVDHRLDRLELGLRKDRRNSAGMLVMMRATGGDFDARVMEVEERVAALEGRA